MHYGHRVQSSERESEHCFCINNCGYFENVSDICVTRPHGRVDYQLIYVKDGEMEFFGTSAARVLGSGMLYLYRPREPQHYRTRGNTTFFWIHFSGYAAKELTAFIEGADLCVGELYEMERLCKDFYMDCRLERGCNERVYAGRLITLLGRVEERMQMPAMRGSVENTAVRTAIEYINEHYRTCPDNETLARMCNMSEFYFIKTFKKCVGCAPQAYRISLVIEQSRELLTYTSYGIGEIAARVGISDALYFSRLFKKHTGVSPAVYRREHAGK
ncbi:MAG: helix-turn-helix transcriptional regulator [Clostridia bacterium]|nr:helix-turn-helix transcriptional regulator [Clostridia bacterium]